MRAQQAVHLIGGIHAAARQGGHVYVPDQEMVCWDTCQAQCHPQSCSESINTAKALSLGVSLACTIAQVAKKSLLLPASAWNGDL